MATGTIPIPMGYFEVFTDFNSFTPPYPAQRRYGIAVSGNALNAPISGDYITYKGYVDGASDTYYTQVFYIEYATTERNRGRMFMRTCINGTPGGWREINRITGGILPNNTDLDSVIQPGIYLLNGSYTYPNLPTGATGLLEVISSSINSSYSVQRIVGGNSMYTRYRYASSGTAFGAWRKFDGTTV